MYVCVKIQQQQIQPRLQTGSKPNRAEPVHEEYHLKLYTP